MKQMNWNINNYIEVKLTEKGYEVLEEYLLSCMTEGYANYIKNKIQQTKDNGDIYKDQMWNIMNIFGEQTYLGCIPCFDSEIVIYMND